MTAESLNQPGWRMPPTDGYTTDDLHTLPDLPPHTELIDGSLVFVSPQRLFHSAAINLLVTGMESTVPPDLLVVREMTVDLDEQNSPEPDISVVRASALADFDQTRFRPEDLVLAVEVVSPESKSRDRFTKLHKYAAAGIPNYWLVEKAGQSNDRIIQVYELSVSTRTYALTGIYHDRIKIDVPYDIDIDLTVPLTPHRR